jgi:hypothetical protein
MYKTLQLFATNTNIFTRINTICNKYKPIYKDKTLFATNTNLFTSIKVIKNTCTHIYTDTKLLKMPSSSKLGFN